MKVGLFGFTFGHENMGCQALTCSFLDLLRRLFPEESFEVVNFHTERTLGNIPELFPEMKFSRCDVKLKDIHFNFIKEVRTCDIIFDETYGDGFSDIYFTKSIYRSTFVKCLCGWTGVPFVLTPQTYGPFQRKSIEWLAAKAIKKATYAYSRDKISADYAERISGREVKTVTDLAFALPHRKLDLGDGKKIGLNVSGLLWQGGFNGKENQFGLLTDYKTYCREIVRYGQENGYEVHLIPHVTKPADSSRVIPDGDYDACCSLAEEFPGTIVAPCFDSPYDVKNYIASMDVFIGARMHATIAAFSSGVITIPFAYSRKFKGLYENLNYPYFVDGTKEDTDALVRKTIEMIEHKEVLTQAQTKAMEYVKNNMKCFEADMIAMMKNIHKK